MSADAFDRVKFMTGAEVLREGSDLATLSRERGFELATEINKGIVMVSANK